MECVPGTGPAAENPTGSGCPVGYQEAPHRAVRPMHYVASVTLYGKRYPVTGL